jgi:hypothetical protein
MLQHLARTKPMFRLSEMLKQKDVETVLLDIEGSVGLAKNKDEMERLKLFENLLKHLHFYLSQWDVLTKWLSEHAEHEDCDDISAFADIFDDYIENTQPYFQDVNKVALAKFSQDLEEIRKLSACMELMNGYLKYFETDLAVAAEYLAKLEQCVQLDGWHSALNFFGFYQPVGKLDQIKVKLLHFVDCAEEDLNDRILERLAARSVNKLSNA